MLTNGMIASGLQAGYATLDSLRAVMRSGNITGIDSKPTTTMLGYSSGGQAVGWATELHPTYAPELEIAGAALGGVVPNLTALLNLRKFFSLCVGISGFVTATNIHY